MLPWVNPPPQTPENYYPHCCSSDTSAESNLPSQMIKGWNIYKCNTEYFSVSPVTLELFEKNKRFSNCCSYFYILDTAGPFYYKYSITFVKLEAGYQCLPSDIPACVTSIHAHIQCPTGYLWNLETCSTCQQLISMNFIPGVVADEPDQPTERGWHRWSRRTGRWRWGRDQWSGMSPAGGVSLPVLWCPSSRSDTIWPAGMLRSGGASGVNAASYADGGMGQSWALTVPVGTINCQLNSEMDMLSTDSTAVMLRSCIAGSK